MSSSPTEPVDYPPFMSKETVKKHVNSKVIIIVVVVVIIVIGLGVGLGVYFGRHKKHKNPAPSPVPVTPPPVTPINPSSKIHTPYKVRMHPTERQYPIIAQPTFNACPAGQKCFNVFNSCPFDLYMGPAGATSTFEVEKIVPMAKFSWNEAETTLMNSFRFVMFDYDPYVDHPVGCATQCATKSFTCLDCQANMELDKVEFDYYSPSANKFRFNFNQTMVDFARIPTFTWLDDKINDPAYANGSEVRQSDFTLACPFREFEDQEIPLYIAQGSTTGIRKCNSLRSYCLDPENVGTNFCQNYFRDQITEAQKWTKSALDASPACSQKVNADGQTFTQYYTSDITPPPTNATAAQILSCQSGTFWSTGNNGTFWCAAFNRGYGASQPCTNDENEFYKITPNNYYSEWSHTKSNNYGFAFDDFPPIVPSSGSRDQEARVFNVWTCPLG